MTALVVPRVGTSLSKIPHRPFFYCKDVRGIIHSPLPIAFFAPTAPVALIVDVEDR